MPERPTRFSHRGALQRPRAAWATTTTSSGARGYGKRWRALRLLVLHEEPACRICLRAQRVTRATTVDHIQPKAHGGTDERSNLQALCSACHKSKTAREHAKR